MQNYIFIYPAIKIKEYKTETSKLSFLYSPELLQQKYKPGQRQFAVNDTAVEIISLFNGLKTYDEIIQSLADKYSESFQLIKNKVDPFLEQMTKQYGYTIKEQSAPIVQDIIISNYSNYYPSVISIELTNKCNLRCKHCYGSFGIENKEIISLKDIYYIIESLGKIEVSIIELTGGDPTVYPYASEVIEKAFDVGVPTVMLLTNGVYFSQKLLDTIIKNKDRMFLQIDLHSLNEDYYDWFTNSRNNLHRVKNNIDFLISNGVRIRICAIFTPGNVHELAEIGEWAYNHGAISYEPSVVTGIGRANLGDPDLFFQDEKGLMEYKKQQDLVLDRHPNFIRDPEVKDVTRKNCGAICSQVSLKVNGEIKLCNMDSGDYFNLKMGNVITHPIKELFDNNKEFLREFREIELPMIENDDCKDCEQKAFCSHCLLRGFIAARKLDKMDKTCKWYQKIHPLVKERFPLHSPAN